MAGPRRLQCQEPDHRSALLLAGGSPSGRAALITERLRQAIDLRESLGIGQIANAYRLVSAESDLLPGLIVDRYDDFLVLQFLVGRSRAMEGAVCRLASRRLLIPAGIFERSDAAVRDKEGLPMTTGVLPAPSRPRWWRSRRTAATSWWTWRKGHKTGFYLDQRENRRKVTGYCAGKDVLNAFSYTGGFGVYAAVYGAGSVLHLDSSAEALELARSNVELNHPRRPLRARIHGGQRLFGAAGISRRRAHL